MKGYKNNETQLFRVEMPEKNMILFSTYASWRVLPAEFRNGINYPERVAFSIGRTLKQNLDKDEINKLPDRYKERIISNYKAETGLNPKLSFIDSVKNFFIRSVNKIDRVLGIKTNIDGNNLEIFEFIKGEKPEDFINIMIGMGIMTGYLAQKNKMCLKEVEEEFISRFHKGFEKGINKGAGK